ncbi:MAG TPA: ABC transporter ATP-binding protein [Ferruginibacter sp.]|nr:ABC transporter ATP-binding protein [Ferruginibacter sp.]HRE62586.1 ABC transporter ATP-binding protein [Ferruginibacter sp.]
MNNISPLLQVKNLSIGFNQNGEVLPIVKGISFEARHGKLTAIVGESGSGKSVTSLAMLQLLPRQAVVSGEAIFNNNAALNLLSATNKVIRSIRGNKIAMIFQEPMTSLNPVFTCGQQVVETIVEHKKISKSEAKKLTLQLFEEVELPNPEIIFKRYPHQISGGQKQRVMIAIAMSCQPALLIADEPTTALDVRVQKNILGLIKKLQQQNNMAVLFITHDLALVNEVADEVIVMQHGNIVEQGPTKQVLMNPQHSYTKALLACRPNKESKGKKLFVVNDFLQNDIPNEAPIYNTSIGSNTVLSVQDLKVYFPAKKNIMGKTTEWFKAVDGVSFDVKEKEVVGLVGESGCGKTTLGRTILQLIKPSSGKILLNGNSINNLSASQMRKTRKDLQIVFQDPYGSLNPRISIGDAILEPLKVHGLYQNNQQRKDKVIELLESVSMKPDSFNRYPHQFSGGQRQRICIARALALQPSFLIFDESVSALDVSVQAQVLNLIQELKESFSFTSIFISHDLSVVHYISDRILVMNKGKLVEQGNADEVMNRPKENYTRQLIDAIPG